MVSISGCAPTVTSVLVLGVYVRVRVRVDSLQLVFDNNDVYVAFKATYRLKHVARNVKKYTE